MSSLQLHCFRQNNVQRRNDVIMRILFRLAVSAHSGSPHEGFRCISIVQAAVYRVIQLSRPPCTPVVETAVYSSCPDHCVLQLSRLPCTSDVQAAVYSKLSRLPWRLPCTSGCPGCCVLQVVQPVLQIVQAAVYFRLSRLLCSSGCPGCTSGCPGCCVLQIVLTAVYSRLSRLSKASSPPESISTGHI